MNFFFLNFPFVPVGHVLQPLHHPTWEKVFLSMKALSVCRSDLSFLYLIICFLKQIMQCHFVAKSWPSRAAMKPPADPVTPVPHQLLRVPSLFLTFLPHLDGIYSTTEVVLGSQNEPQSLSCLVFHVPNWHQACPQALNCLRGINHGLHPPLYTLPSLTDGT